MVVDYDDSVVSLSNMPHGMKETKKIIDSVLKIWFRNEVFVVDQSGVLSACNAGDAAEASGSIPRWKDPPEKEVVIHPNILA